MHGRAQLWLAVLSGGGGDVQGSIVVFFFGRFLLRDSVLAWAKKKKTVGCESLPACAATL